MSYPGDNVAKTAFDVMMRRGWWAESELDGSWTVFSWSEDGTFKGPLQKKAGQLINRMDPFTALVEADRWYKKNVDL